MLREIVEKPLLKRARTCESCGESFECQIGLKGCWCTHVELSDEDREQISKNFSDCLCRNCLEAAAAKTQ